MVTIMNAEEIREYCLAHPGVSEGFPFDENSLVFKIMGKIFCISDLEGKIGIALKNTPEKIIEMREEWSCVTSASHLSHIHWNNITDTRAVPDVLLKRWIDDSYQIMVAGLTRKLREELKKNKHKNDGI
jgi:predicted DNA-binding protein (MmcQ/YjbR family)